jgi:glyoxylase-like metal-dependent hydrolase (beta-lactamase superfamily II)
VSDAVAPVAESIWQVRIPLPYLLNHVYCYLLYGDDGWTIVDTGLHTEDGERTWQSAWAELGIQPRDIKKLLVTHMHPDHFGMAGWLHIQTGAPVVMSERDRQQAIGTWIERAGRGEVMADFMRANGVPEAIADAIAEAGEATARLTLPAPDHLHTFDRPSIEMGGRQFEIIAAPGHCDGQIMLYDPDDQLMLSADHVLNPITPNIGQWPDGDGAPLERYLASLSAVRDMAVRMALSGHRRIITDWAGRIDELQAHHALRLERMEHVASTGATVFEVAAHIFEFERLTVHELRFATAETLAHLEFLRAQNVLTRELREGVWWYQVTG